jgi:MurNAc alpha-1-phosphate uridylyltransferase
MNVMLLAAGRGTRLRSVAQDVPKALVNIGGEPLLARQLRYLEGQGVSRVVVNASHMHEKMLAFARDYTGSIDLKVIVEHELLGTAGGVRHALPQLGPAPFLVLYGDVLTTEPLAPLEDQHARLSTVATLAVYESADLEGKGTVEASPDDLITGFSEKAAAPPVARALVNAGIYVLDATWVGLIPPGRICDFGHDIFPEAVSRGDRLGVYRMGTPVLDVGTPRTLEIARRDARVPGPPSG